MTLNDGALTKAEILKAHSPRAIARAGIEFEVARRLIETLNESGYSIAIEDHSSEESTPATDIFETLRALFDTDEAYLTVKRGESEQSFILLVFGNDGYDLISDYGMSLESVLQPVFAWIDEQQGRGT